jgi:hypothetical protein
MDCKNRGSPTQTGSGTLTEGKTSSEGRVSISQRFRKQQFNRKKTPSVETSDPARDFVIAQRALYKHKAQQKKDFKKKFFEKVDHEFDHFLEPAIQQWDDGEPFHFTCFISEYLPVWEERYPDLPFLSAYARWVNMYKKPWNIDTQVEFYNLLMCGNLTVQQFQASLETAEQQGLWDAATPSFLKEGVASATKSLERLSFAAEKVATQAEETIEGVKDFFTDNKTKIFTSVGLALASLAYAPTFVTVILEVLKLIVSYTNFITDIPTYLASVWPTICKMYRWTLMKTGLQGSREAQPAAEYSVHWTRGVQQSDEEIASTVLTREFWNTAGVLAAGVGTLIGASVFMPESLQVSSIATKAYQRASMNIATKRIQDGIEGFCDMVFKYAKKAMAELCPEGTFIKSFDEWLHESRVDVTSFLSRVAQVTDPSKRDEILNKPSTKVELDELVKIAHSLEIAIAEGKLDKKSQQVTLCRDSMRKLLNFVTFFANAHQEQVRDTPFSVCFFSEPGVGKSIITKTVADNLCDPEKGCTVPVNEENFLYFRSSCDKFYSNYRGQSVVVIDDWGQSRSSSPDNSEMRDYIAMISATPFSPPQADIADKGRPFNSKLIITTTNVPYPVPTEIQQPSAIHRRRNFMWEVIVSDPSKSLEDPYRYGFYRHASDKLGRLNSQPYDFEDMVYAMIPVFNSWNEKNQTIKSVGKFQFKKPLPVTSGRLGYGPTKALQESEVSELTPQFRTRAAKERWEREQRQKELANRFTQLNLERSISRNRAHITRKAREEAAIYSSSWPSQTTMSDALNMRDGFFYCPCCGSTECKGDTNDIIVCEDYGNIMANGWRAIKEYNARAKAVGARMRYCFCAENMDLHLYIVTVGGHYDPSFSTHTYNLLNYSQWTQDEFAIFWKFWAYDLLWEDPDYDDNPYDFEVGSKGHFRDWMERLTNKERIMLDGKSPFPVPDFFQQVDMEVAEQQGVEWLEMAPDHIEVDGTISEGDYDMCEHTAQLELEEARDADEKTTFAAIFENTSYAKAKIYALKAVIGLGIVWTALKATRALYSLFGEKKTKPSVSTTIIESNDGHVTKIVESFPETMRETMLGILSSVIAEGAAHAAVAVFTAEGGASAYGEAQTIRAVARKNMKFARPVAKAVRQELLSACPPAFADAPTRLEIAEAQGCSDSNGLDLALNVIGPKSCFTIRRKGAPEEGVNSVAIKGFGIKGRLVAFPWHFMPTVPTVLETTIHCAQRTVHMSVDYRKAVRCMNGDSPMDLALIELDYNIESFRDITEHFVREAQLQKLHNFKSMMVKHQSEAGGYCLTTDFIDTTSLVSAGRSFSYGPSYQDQDKLLLDGYLYNVPTKKGDCGALLMCLNPALQGRIFAFHVAGISNNEKGLGAPITYEVLTDNIKQHFPKLTFGKMREPAEEHVSFDDEKISKRTVNTYGEVEFAGIVNPRLAQRMPTKHDIVPSLLFDKVFPHTKDTSVLSPSDPRIVKEECPQDYLSPLDEGGKKYSVQPTPFPDDLVRKAGTLIREQLSAYKPHGMSLRSLSEEETINGNEFAQYTGMDMSTSPGMPYKNVRPHGSKGKHIFFTFDEETQKYQLDMTARVYGINPAQKLLDDITEFEHCAMNNLDVPFHMNYENLKQETIAIKKVRSGTTRLFSCAPLAINMLFRKYFGAFVAMMNQNCVDLPSSVGINPTGADWTLLAKRLWENGDCIIAGDYQKWDGKLMGSVMQAFVRDVINPLYSADARRRGVPEEQIEKENRMRLRLIDYAIHTYTIFGNVMALKHQGNPSGIPITSDLNSGANWMYIIVAYISLFRQHRKDNPTCKHCKDLREEDVMTEVIKAFYGDDHLLSVARRSRCFFTFNTLRCFFESHGIGYTDALKRGGVCPDFMSLNDVSYLKRGFKDDEELFGYLRAPLELDSIRDQINWVKKGNDPIEAVLQNVKSAMGEFFHHGEEQYKEASDQLTAALRQLQDEMLETSTKTFVVPTFDYQSERRNWLDQFN